MKTKHVIRSYPDIKYLGNKFIVLNLALSLLEKVFFKVFMTDMCEPRRGTAINFRFYVYNVTDMSFVIYMIPNK